MRAIKKGATSQSIYVVILDSASTTGGKKTGLAFNTSSLTAYYARNGGSATAITLATLAAANSAYSSGGFKEVDATNMPGLYRLDLPDAAVASAANIDSVVVTLTGATGMVSVNEEIQLTGLDLSNDVVRAGLTALPNAAAEAAGGLYTRGTGAGQIEQEDNGKISINVKQWLRGTIPAVTVTGVPLVDLKAILGTTLTETAGLLAGGFKKFFNVASPTLTCLGVDQTGDGYARLGAPAGASHAADVAAVKVDTAAIKVQTDKFVFSVANQVDSNVLDWKSSTAPAMTGDAFARLGAPAGASIAADLATIASYIDTEVAAILAAVDTEVAAILAKTNNLPGGIQKNTALSAFEFYMVDSSDHVTGKTGLTPTCQRSINGGAFGACANAPAEIGSGFYKIDLAAADLNGDTIGLKFTSAGADQTSFTIKTNP